MRRPLSLLLAGLFAFAVVTPALLIGDSPASAAPIAGAPTTYCADPDTDPSMDTGAGTMITCDTRVENTITGFDPITLVATGTSVVSVTECTGPANGRLDPSDLTCAVDEQILVNLVTHVDQCNEVGYGGGNVLECHVEVINRFVGVTPQAILDATVNQCNVPQDAGLDKTGCDPFPATTPNATVTQCNDSSYGGGQEDFNCIATGNTTTASLSVTVNQCNNSNYGGGSWLNCSASISNEIIPGETSPPTNGPTNGPTQAPTNAPTQAPTNGPTNAPTNAPTQAPTNGPTNAPTQAPTQAPTNGPTLAPSDARTIAPDSAPTAAPFALPDTNTGAGPSAQQRGSGTPLFMIGLLALAVVAWMIGLDRRRAAKT